jgi:hypothetical protein
VYVVSKSWRNSQAIHDLSGPKGDAGAGTGLVERLPLLGRELEHQRIAQRVKLKKDLVHKKRSERDHIVVTFVRHTLEERGSCQEPTRT